MSYFNNEGKCYLEETDNSLVLGAKKLIDGKLIYDIHDVIRKMIN